jgi:hypothetical protein
MPVITREDLIALGFRFENEINEEEVNNIVLDITGYVIKAASESKFSYTWVSETPLRPMVRYHVIKKLLDKFLGCDIVGIGPSSIYICWSPRSK